MTSYDMTPLVPELRGVRRLGGGNPRPLWKHWPNCLHTQYHLTCQEFEGILLESDNCCDVCRVDATEAQIRLCIDHDHALGWRAIRGLVCQPCNVQLARIDALEILPNRDEADYLANVWHLRTGFEPLNCPTTCRLKSHKADPPPAVARDEPRRPRPVPHWVI